MHDPLRDSWQAFTPEALLGVAGLSKFILVVRGDGKGYFGKVESITSSYAYLVNGSERRSVNFGRMTTRFRLIEMPERPIPEMGNPTLFKG